MYSKKIFGLALVVLLLVSHAIAAGSRTVQSPGFAFDVPEGVVFREYPSVLGGRFIPVANLENKYYYAVMRLETFWNQWPELVTEHFIKKWTILACAADGAGSSQWCEEDSLALEQFISGQGIPGYKVRRTRIVETYGENRSEKKEYTDLIVVFDIKDRLDGETRLAAFVCEDKSCFDLVQSVGKSFR